MSADALRYWSRRWALQHARSLAETPTSWLWRVECADGAEAVLKVSTDKGKIAEAGATDALRIWGAEAAVRVLDAEPGAVLLEALDGDLLETPDDEDCLPVLLDVARRLNSAGQGCDTGFPTLSERMERLAGAHFLDKRYNALLDRAGAMAQRLLKTTERDVLLHGDLHHGNVLRRYGEAAPTWVAIDPQPILGDPAYAASNLFGNPVGHKDILFRKDRMTRLAGAAADALGLPQQRIFGWGYVHNCLSAIWSNDDQRDPLERLAVAQQMATEAGWA